MQTGPFASLPRPRRPRRESAVSVRCWVLRRPSFRTTLMENVFRDGGEILHSLHGGVRHVAAVYIQPLPRLGAKLYELHGLLVANDRAVKSKIDAFHKSPLGS